MCNRRRVPLWTYHRGQVPDTLVNHGSTHAGWNLWLHGRTRTSSPTVKSSVQIVHPKMSPSSSDTLVVTADGLALPLSLLSSLAIGARGMPVGESPVGGALPAPDVGTSRAWSPSVPALLDRRDSPS